MLTRRDIATCLILSLVTCGFYGIYWIYKLDEDLKLELDNDNNPSLDILLSFLTCGLYGIYLFYRNAQQILIIQDRYGVDGTDNTLISLILALLGLGIVALIIQQDSINKIIDSASDINSDMIDPLK